MAIVGTTLLEGLFPEARIESEMESASPEFKKESHARNLVSIVKDLALGWQAVVDLVYTFIAFLTLLIARFVEGEIQKGWLVFSVLISFTIANIFLLCRSIMIGPVNFVALPVDLLGLGLIRLSWRRISFIFVYVANFILIAAIVAEIHSVNTNHIELKTEPAFNATTE